MLKKIRSLTEQHAILSAIIIFVIFDSFLYGIGRILTLLPDNLLIDYFNEIILILIPIGVVFLFGFSNVFKKGHFFRGLYCFLPFIALQLVVLATVLVKNMNNAEATFNSWSVIVFNVFMVLCVGIREECIYRATFQNIVAKKYANSPKGIWITVIVSSALFGLCHVTNIFFGVQPLAVLSQVYSAFVLGILFGAVYLRSGSIWSVILVHTLVDLGGLGGSTFLQQVSDIEEMNQLSFSWGSVAFDVFYIALAIYLLRPSKHKQIYESLCFADEKAESNAQA